MTALRTGGPAFCPRCGSAQPAEAHFCPRCGLDLAGIEVPAAHTEAVVSAPAAPPAPVAAGAAALVPAPAGAPLAVPPVVSSWGSPALAPAPAMPTGSAPAWAPARLPVASATGRRATRAGWVLVALGGLGFLAVAVGIIIAAGGLGSDGPLASWDRMLTDPATIADGESFDIAIGAAGADHGTTGPVWMIIDWRPEDRALDPDAVGRLVACAPTDCHFRDDTAAGRTVVSWPGLGAGERQTYVVTVRVTGIASGTTFPYRVATGTGPDESAIAGGRRWSLDAEVR